jgi:hypothetical protein
MHVSAACAQQVRQIKMKLKILIILILISYKFSYSESNVIFLTNLPRLEISSNIGIAWLLQGNVNLNLNDHLYIKYRKSGSLLSLEEAFIIGYQEILSSKGRLQIGIGNSKGHVDPFVPGGPNIDDITEYWNTFTFESNVINYLNIKVIKLGLN